MARSKLTERDLKRELDTFRETYPRLAPDQLFVLWFLRAFITENENSAADALTGGAHDKGIDAIILDADTRNVFIVQGKYRERLNGKNEHRNDVLSFANLALMLSGDSKPFNDFAQTLAPEVNERIEKARRRILDGYHLHLYYVTMGRCSSDLLKEAERSARAAEGQVTFQFFNGQQVFLLLEDYLGGVAPPVPTLDLEMESGNGVEVKGIFHRYDRATDIESWVFSMTSHGIAELYAQAGDRLFARNIRGFLGSTEINRGMAQTVDSEPEFFWYYNNGVTIICDDAEETSSRGKHILRVKNPQVINGQQTTRTLFRSAPKSDKASVTVKVIRVSRDDDESGERFEKLVSNIVSATNWQNAIMPSDLVANDRRQIEIERELRKLGYWYIRKRQKRSEARRVAGSKRYIMLTKEKVAQAVAACDLDPLVVREGKEGLFEERLYSSVFPNSDPYYYLTRYWLMSTIGYAAEGYPERAYAKWLVLNFMWRHVGVLVRSRSRAEAFRWEWEKNGFALHHLWKANNMVFKAAARFFRLKRGRGERAIDVSTFFKRKNLHRDFAKFWDGSNNPYRTPFRQAMRKFERVLIEDTEE